MKKALAAGVLKATMLTYFYPEVTVEKMSSYPVSYTHLDVDKRQDYSIGIDSDGKMYRQDVAEENGEIEPPNFLLSVESH